MLLVGVSYKPNVADLRESPALEILSMLADQGADVGFHDPFFGSVRLRNGSELTATMDPDAFGADLVVLHTDHDNVDWEWLSPEVLVLDTTYRRTDLPRRVQL